VKVSSSLHYTIRFFGITGDCPALKMILNFINHQGYYCCWLCFVRGEHVQNKRQYYYQPPIELRSSQSYNEHGVQAATRHSNVYGHLGISVLKNLLDIPLPQSIIVDYLHVSLLRHAKCILAQLYRKLKPTERDLLDQRLKEQPFPHYFNRKMRAASNLSFIKGTELRNIILYGLLPLIRPFLPIDLVAHLSLYVTFLRILHSERSFGAKTSEIAQKLFTSYYEDHELYYTGLQNFVLHVQIHLPELYDAVGSLCNIGTFGQEDLIG
ncbi:unnamed protein product, partial [Didymodactylos carnosus]